MVDLTKEEQEYQRYMEELERQEQSKQSNPPYSPAMFASQDKQNLIEWELDFKPELENIERLLRCDILVKDRDGNEYWAPNPDKNRVFFNELGVNDIIRTIIILVNKNKALSNYTAEEINTRVCQIKHELRILIYNNYEEYGLDNEYKQNNYSMIVLTIGSIIEDVYRRAMGGETHRGLNEQRLVTQNEPLGNTRGYNMSGVPSLPRKRGISSVLPWNWGKI